MPTDRLDVVVIGGGPAGLSAGLILARCRREVLIVDSGRPRNAATGAVHGFLTRDGVPPAELRRIAREQVAAYPSARVLDVAAIDAKRAVDGFEIDLDGGATVRSRCLVLAFGVQDRFAIAGTHELYGRGIYPCPYCDAWEHRDAPMAAIGAEASGLALKLRRWSADTVWCSMGAQPPDDARQRQLEERGIRTLASPIQRIERIADGIRLTFADGSGLDRRAGFIGPDREPHPPFVAALGCQSEQDCLQCDRRGATCVDGLYIVGDLSRNAQFAIVAAAEGAMAAVAADEYLDQLDLGVAR
ncbi:MAG: NAD(P)/FAD-dependent oxidoreductase [Planctomycetes bacterium]|nr:NAD(P)/FAD-dependent oxidoreductase [Planctomycetota bacterium]